jgi:hypothetical protein
MCAISLGALDAFAHRLYLRDPRGLSARPALAPVSIMGRSWLLIVRDFQIRYEYLITREQGELFQEITKDANAIHKTMNVVSGAMTAAKMLMPIEILLPFLRISSAGFRFRAPAFYGERTVSSIWWKGGAEGAARLEVSVSQRGQEVATGTLTGKVGWAQETTEILEGAVDEKQLQTVTAFMRTLGIESTYYFEKGGLPDFTYPLAYVASLPSGEIVKQFEGSGGMITSLLLTMGEEQKIPLVSQRAPKVRVRLGRIKKAFRRIFTDIIDGVITRCRGWAVVNPIAEFPYLNH